VARQNGQGSRVERDVRSGGGHDAPLARHETLWQRFGLTAFARALLLLCAAVELDASIGPLCGVAQGDPLRSYPTFSLALAALPGAHWSAIVPGGPRRHWRLIQLTPGDSLTSAPIRIDERILHFFAGINDVDE